MNQDFVTSNRGISIIYQVVMSKIATAQFQCSKSHCYPAWSSNVYLEFTAGVLGTYS